MIKVKGVHTVEGYEQKHRQNSDYPIDNDHPRLDLARAAILKYGINYRAERILSGIWLQVGTRVDVHLHRKNRYVKNLQNEKQW